MSSVLQRFEQRLEGAVTGVFARAFRSAVQPVEIAAALQREVDSAAQALSRDRLLVPNRFVVELSASDYARLSPYGETLSSELARLVEEHVTEQRYTLAGPLEITFDEAPDLGTGRFYVRSSAHASVTPASSSAGERMTETQIRSSDVVIEVNGTRHRISEPGVVIGRGNEADLRINDPGISRKHAQIFFAPGEFGTEVFVRDLGSTNGVLLNGQRVDERRVHDGSAIMLGNTHLIVHISEPRGATGDETSHETDADV